MEKDRQLQEKDRQLAKRDEVVMEKDRQLQEKDRKLQEKDRQLQAQIAKKDEQLLKKDDEQKSIIKQLQERDRKLDDLSRMLEHLKCAVANIHGIVSSNVVLCVTLTGFKHMKDNKVRWFSPPYFTHVNGYKMCFEVDFHYSSGTSLRIDSYMMKGPYDDHLQWPFKGKVIIQLLNQRGNHHHYDYVFDYTDNNVKGKRVTSGEQGDYVNTQSKRLLLCQLGYSGSTDSQYLRDDCLKFRVIMTK